MKLTKKLASSQLRINRKRTIWTLLGIALSTAMITAVYGFAVSGYFAIIEILDGSNIRREYMVTVAFISAVLSFIIVVASVIVISNSFRVSAGQRLKQFGILKSVGATKKQIVEIIMNESVLLSLMGIPAGIALGLFVQFVGLEIANFLLGSMNRHSPGSDLIFNFVVAWQAILASIAVAFVTILLSAWLPARKAAKIAAIDAIRGTGETKIKRSQVRANWFVKKLFGFEGMLASKSLKRSKRNFRATVVSLTISIVLFIGVSSFGAQLNRMTKLVIRASDANVVGIFSSSSMIVEREDGTILRKFETLSSEDAEIITERLREFPNTTVFGAGDNGGTWAFSAPIPREMLTQKYYEWFAPLYGIETEAFNMVINLITLDAESYAEVCRLAGVPLGSNILINYSRERVYDRWTEFTPFVFSEQILQIPMIENGVKDSSELQDLPLHGVLEVGNIPRNVQYVSRGSVNIIVPSLDSGRYRWLAASADPNGFTEFARGVLDEFISRDSEINVNVGVHNIAAEENMQRNIALLVMVFTFGFVGMLTLIGLTNVISTISANVRSRAREFAVLRSVGMTCGGLNRMLNLESILCSAKSLLIGLPLGVLASYLIYQGIMASVYFAFEFPWLPVVQSVLAVFVITWVTMRFAATRLRTDNIVETIRTDSGL